MFKRKPSSNHTIDTLIGATTRINGDVEFAGGFHLDGTIKGNLTCERGSVGTLSVSERACIDGSVMATDVVLNGIVKGDIDASHRIELGAKARVLGNVYYTVIETAVGAQINGKLIHRPESETPGAADAAAPGQGEPGVSDSSQTGPEL